MKHITHLLKLLVLIQIVILTRPGLVFCQQPINFGETITGNISVAGEVDIYSFSGNSGDKILIRMSEGTSWSVYLEPLIKLYNPSGALLEDSANSAQAEIFISLPSNGTYTIFASDAEGDDTGDYGIFIQRTFNPGNAQNINYGDNVTSDISTSGEADTYTFSGNAGDIIVARMSEGTDWSVYLEPFIEIYGPAGNLVVENSDDAQAGIYMQLADDGTYTILASDSYPGEDNGNYGIFIQRTFDPGNAYLLEYGENYSSNISTSGEVDTYIFNGSANDSIIIQLTESTGWSVYLEPFIELYSPSGSFLISAWDESQAQLGYKLIENGSYVILASDYYPGEDDGDYSIFLFGFTGPNNENDILSYSFDEQTNEAIIDTLNHTVSIEVKYATSLENLIATFTLSNGASASVNGVTQISGITQNDFTNPVTYEVTAEDGISVQNWIVSVSIAPNTETDILSYSFPEQIGDEIINDLSHTVEVVVEEYSDLTNLVASFSLSEGATATIDGINQVSGVTSNDFTDIVTYLITADDNISSQEWHISVEKSSGIFSQLLSGNNIFPNPFHNEVTVKFNNTSHTDYTLSLFNSLGNKVLEIQGITSDKIVLGKGNLKPGLYFIELKGDKILQGKIIVQ